MERAGETGEEIDAPPIGTKSSDRHAMIQACLPGRPISRGRIRFARHTLCTGRLSGGKAQRQQAGLLARDSLSPAFPRVNPQWPHRRMNNSPLQRRVRVGIGVLTPSPTSLRVGRPRKLENQPPRSGPNPSGKLTPAAARTIACDREDSSGKKNWWWGSLSTGFRLLRPVAPQHLVRTCRFTPPG